jgi:chromosome segregation ATPase
METLNIPEHEKIFNEICHKLNELSQDEDQKSSKDRVIQLDKMQNQLKNFQIELVSNHEDMKLKIESLEKMTTSNSDLTQKVKELTDLLNQERSHNSKLSTDLAKSLDLSLKLQLEIQEIKTKAIQAQMDDRKQYLENYESLQFDFQKEKSKLLDMNQLLAGENKQKEEQISYLTQRINELETGMTEIEATSQEQAETIRHLMTVAENKIVELKLESDRLNSELDNVKGQYAQAATQVEIMKKENFALKDYINKMTQFQQQIFTANQPAKQTANQQVK